RSTSQGGDFGSNGAVGNIGVGAVRKAQPAPRANPAANAARPRNDAKGRQATSRYDVLSLRRTAIILTSMQWIAPRSDIRRGVLRPRLNRDDASGASDH